MCDIIFTQIINNKKKTTSHYLTFFLKKKLSVHTKYLYFFFEHIRRFNFFF